MENTTVTPDKHIPQIGEAFYSHQKTGSFYVDYCKEPWTVISVNKNVTQIQAQRAALIFNGARYFNTIPDNIVPDLTGETVTFKWSTVKQRWQHTSHSGDKYPDIAVWGEGYQYQPYLD